MKLIFGISFLLLSLISIIIVPKLTTLFQFGNSYGIETKAEMIDFKLKNVNGDNFQLSDLKGNLVYIYFGYTNCVNLCPLRMSSLLELSKQVIRKDVRYIYITIDPKQDIEEKLKAFSKGLGEKFSFLYSDTETIKEIAKKYKIYFETLDENQWNHSDRLYLLDKDLKIRFIYLTSHNDISRLKDDLNQL